MSSGQKTPAAHWDEVYARTPTAELSWYQAQAQPSLDLIRSTGVAADAPIIDVGGGASTLVDHLMGLEYSSLTVLDISCAALQICRERLGSRAPQVRWLAADVTQESQRLGPYDVWHDRAVFHFLTKETARRRYVETVQRSVTPGGHVIMATFGEEGPTQCSGLPVVRYNAEQLHIELGERAFTLADTRKQLHQTPRGSVQVFLYCVFQKL